MAGLSQSRRGQQAVAGPEAQERQRPLLSASSADSGRPQRVVGCRPLRGSLNAPDARRKLLAAGELPIGEH
jgi:hypothetical protein